MLSQYTSQLRSFIIPLLIVIGVYYPSSLNGEILTSFEFLAFIPVLILLLYLIITQDTYDKTMLLFAVGINLILMIYTILSYHMYESRSWGNYPSYVVLSMLFLVDWKFIGYNKFIKFSFILTLLGQLVLSYGILTQNDAIRDFILMHYTGGFDNLLPFMMGDLKPVNTFATHSVAAFYHFVFFYICLKSYMAFNKYYWLFLACIFLFLLAMVRSNTAIGYTFVSFVLLFKWLGKSPKVLIAFIVLFLGIVLTLFLYFQDVVALLVGSDIIAILSKDNNGLLSRYSTSGNYLEPTINYIKDHPFLALGMNYNPDLFYTDSGFIIYFLRGSLFLVMFVYGGFYLFIRRSISNYSESVFLFFCFMLFELGYPNLINTRTLYILPFIIVYLNYLNNIKSHVND